MNKIRIPKEFQLFGQTIKVKHSNLLSHDRDLVGSAKLRDNTIILQKSNNGVKVPRDYMEDIFLEEMLHFVLTMLREDEVNNEAFVQRLSHCIHQVFKTAKY